MLTLWIHLVAFYEVVVLNCIQPVNWKYCSRLDQWLVPELVEGYEIWAGDKMPYQNESVYLNSLGNHKD